MLPGFALYSRREYDAFPINGLIEYLQTIRYESQRQHATKFTHQSRCCRDRYSRKFTAHIYKCQFRDLL